MTVRAQLLLVIAYLLLVATVSLAVPLAINVHDRVSAELRDEASARASVIAASASDHTEDEGSLDLQGLADAGSRSANGRVLIVDRRGQLLADSARSAPVGTSFVNRTEIARALTGRRVQIERSSETLGERILATAVPIVHDGRPDGAVRVTQSMAAVSSATNRSTAGIAALTAIVLALGLLAAVVLSGRLARPARALEAAAGRVADGELDTTVQPDGPRELQHLAVAFNTMTGQVRELVDAQRRFVADASHQLRTPLTGTRLQIEQVAHARDLAEARASAQVALAEVDRLARTVDELLVLSADEPLERVREPLHTGDLAIEAFARWEATAEARGQTLTVETADGGRVRTSPVDAEQALDVLIENAINYAPAGATLHLEAVGPVVRVVDEGPGMTDEDRALAFERFARGSAAAHAPGSGLGLSIARKLAERNGGTVTLRPREDRNGTVAELRLADEGAARV